MYHRVHGRKERSTEANEAMILKAAESLIERLQKGEKILCLECKEGYYVTSAKDISLLREFACEKCNSIVRVTPCIIVE